jgi:NhaP-type Na+/H+ or K+/H+ antiporter
VTSQTANRIIVGQGVLAAMSIVAIVLFAYWRIIDGAAAVASILAITGVTTGTSQAVHAKVKPRAESIPSPRNGR